MENDSIATFRSALLQTLLRMLSERGLLGGELLAAEELNEKWKAAAPAYMADAVPQMTDYPAAAVAWAGYVGMGAAALWDGDWERLHDDKRDVYRFFADGRGFDSLDEYVSEEFLGMPSDGADAGRVADAMLACSRTALSMMRRTFEAQSRDAFLAFAAAAGLFFELGVAVELFRRGYKYVKVTLPAAGVVQ